MAALFVVLGKFYVGTHKEIYIDNVEIQIIPWREEDKKLPRRDDSLSEVIKNKHYD